MAPVTSNIAPGLPTFLKTLRTARVDASIEHLISLLKRRQICGARPCAVATAQLLRRVVDTFRGRDVHSLLERIRSVGARLTSAQPHELVTGNIVRRVLGLIREVEEEQNKDDEEEDDATISLDKPNTKVPLTPNLQAAHQISHHSPPPLGTTGLGVLMERSSDTNTSETSSMTSSVEQLRRPLLHRSGTSAMPAGSLFNLFSHPASPSQAGSPREPLTPSKRTDYQGISNLTQSLVAAGLSSNSNSSNIKDLRDDVLAGIGELLDEIDQAEEQIAAYALDHIYSDAIVLTYAASTTVQRFLLAAARKRKFTVLHAEGFPNHHHDAHSMLLHGRKKRRGATSGSENDSANAAGTTTTTDNDNESSTFPGDPADSRFRPLTAAGITVILIPDSAIFALMSRVNKVLLPATAVLSNGGVLCPSGAASIALAARHHATQVLVAAGVYKFSPLRSFNIEEELYEEGDPGHVLDFRQGEMVERLTGGVRNPLVDYVAPELVEGYVTNLGGLGRSKLVNVIKDHYRDEDLDLTDPLEAGLAVPTSAPAA